MVTAPGNLFQEHFGRYTMPLYVVMASLGVGLLFGVLATGTLSIADRVVLVDYIHKFLGVEAVGPVLHGIFAQALAANLKIVGLVYLLGVSVAGMPIVVALVFFRGFVVGFSASFVVSTMHWHGVLLGIVAIGLDNVFMLPALLIVAAVSLGFSWQLVRPKNRAVSLGKGFAFFTGLVVVMAAVTLVGTVLESYGAPILIHALGPMAL